MLRGSPGARSSRLRGARALRSPVTGYSVQRIVELLPVALDGLRHPLRGRAAGDQELELGLQRRVHARRGPVRVEQEPIVVRDLREGVVDLRQVRVVLRRLGAPVRRELPRAGEAADGSPHAARTRRNDRYADVLAEPRMDDRRVPIAAHPEDSLALGEDGRRRVVGDRVVVGVEVTRLRPGLELRERLDRPRRVEARPRDVVDPVADVLRLLVGAPDAAEEVNEAVSLLVALLDHGLALGEPRADQRERLVESGERRGDAVWIDADRAELCPIEEDGDVLARLGDAPYRALAE